MKIDVRCPSCSSRGSIEISEEQIKNISRGVLAVNIAKKAICDHSFVAYVDKNLRVRDSFIADFLIELPELAPPEQEEITEIEDFDLDLINLNLPALLIAFIIRACFLKVNVLVLDDRKFLYKHIENFFEYIMTNSFEYNLTIISNDEYKQNKKNYNNYLVLEERNIVKDKKNIVTKKKLDIERSIVQKYLAETDRKSSIIIIKNEIHKSYELAKTIGDLINNLEEKGTLNSKKLIDHVEEIHNVKIQIPYLKFLLEIVENYWEMTVPKISDVSNFLGFL